MTAILSKLHEVSVQHGVYLVWDPQILQHSRVLLRPIFALLQGHGLINLNNLLFKLEFVLPV